MRAPEQPTRPPDSRVLILGGGFGGVYAALELEKMLSRREGLEVTLVTRDNFFLFAKDFACVTDGPRRAAASRAVGSAA